VVSEVNLIVLLLSRLHNERPVAVMQRIQIAGITLNVYKCEFGVTKTKFLGHVIDESGIRAYPDKTKVIMDFPIPLNRRELRQFFGE